MSNHEAIATVTAAMSEIALGAANLAVNNATMHLGRPGEGVGQGSNPVVCVYLYKVVPNESLRNHCQPLRNATGRMIDQSTIALDLHYLISFYGDANKFEPERMMARVIEALETQPLISRSLIEKVIADNHDLLGFSDLHLAEESVKARLVEMDLESMSKLWSIFFQVPYALSLPYVCSHVVIESEQLAGPSLPVTHRAITALPASSLQLKRVVPAEGQQAIHWGQLLVIKGEQLSREGVAVLIDSEPVDLTGATITQKQIQFSLQTDTFSGQLLAAGVHRLQLSESVAQGQTRQSDSVFFAIRPELTNIQVLPDDGLLQVTFSPPIQAGQQVSLQLDQRVVDNPNRLVMKPIDVPSSDFPLSQLSFSYSATVAGEYLVQVQVDGVTSLLQTASDPAVQNYGQITGPIVVLP